MSQMEKVLYWYSSLPTIASRKMISFPFSFQEWHHFWKNYVLGAIHLPKMIPIFYHQEVIAQDGGRLSKTAKY